MSERSSSRDNNSSLGNIESSKDIKPKNNIISKLQAKTNKNAVHKEVVDNFSEEDGKFINKK